MTKSRKDDADKKAVDEPREVTAAEGKKWYSPGAVGGGPQTLLEAARALDDPQSLADLVRVLRDLAPRVELDDPEIAPLHFAKMLELLVWRFELLVRGGALDRVLPRLTGLPILYSPDNGEGASKWKMARALFDLKRVATDAPTQHHGIESSVARRYDFGVTAAQLARILRFAGAEFPAWAALRKQATAVWHRSFRRDKRTIPYRVRVFRCEGSELRLPTGKTVDGTYLLHWPDWLDLCEGLPRRRLDNPAQYRNAGASALDEFFATPGNEIALKLAGTKVGGEDMSAKFAEAKRRVLDALDAL